MYPARFFGKGPKSRKEVITMPGEKYASIKRPRVYEALKRKGYSKTKAAKISNAMGTGRKRKTTKSPRRRSRR
jgi:hypothetical protein